MFYLLGPRDVRDMHQTIYSLIKSNEYPKIGYIFDFAFYYSTRWIFLLHENPGIRLQLLQTQRNPFPWHIQIQNHSFDHISHRYQLRRMLHFLNPCHLRNVYQTLNALFQYNESTIIRNIHNFPFYSGTNRILFLYFGPGIRLNLLIP